VLAKLPMAKSGRRQGKQTERVHERLDAAVAEAEAGGALVLDDDRCGDSVEAVFADQAVVAKRFAHSRRRLASKPISRSAGRLRSARPISKSFSSTK